MVTIEKVDTADKAQVKRFVQYYYDLYKDCPQWVPPLVDDVKLMMNRKKYPFYEHSDADFFVAEREGRLVAVAGGSTASSTRASAPAVSGTEGYEFFVRHVPVVRLRALMSARPSPFTSATATLRSAARARSIAFLMTPGPLTPTLITVSGSPIP